MIQAWHNFWTNQQGVTITVFAMAIPMIIAAVGMAMDLSRIYLVKKRLGMSLDAAALATAGSSGDSSALEARMNVYFERNFEDGRIGEITQLHMENLDTELIITATARVDTMFMTIFNVNYVDVEAEAAVQKELRGIEAVLVMDNTGSMSSNNNIGTLREAAKNFVDIMFDRAPDPSVIKIGLVPYSTSVNVGPYGLGKNPDGTNYGAGLEFVNNPMDLDYTTNYYDNTDWMGCVIEDVPLDVEDHEGNWDMYRWCRNPDTDEPICDYYWHYGTKYARRRPNNICPITHITPLMNDQEYLKDELDTMIARGHTLGNVGMVWGWRVISPEFPFEEGAPYNDEEWRKAVIMMTDGNNLMNNTFSAYGRTSSHSIRTTQLNEKFEDVCEGMKEKGIILYTITFTSGINENTKDYYRDCATDSTKYYDAPSQNDLVEAFEAISRELSNLYVKR